MRNLQNFIEAQSSDSDCCLVVTSVKKMNLTVPYDFAGLLVPVPPIDDASQRFFTAVFCPILLCPLHYSLSTGHPGELGMYGTVCRNFFWVHFESSVYKTVEDCCLCIRNRRTKDSNKTLCLFMYSEPLEYVAIRILGPIPNT